MTINNRVYPIEEMIESRKAFKRSLENVLAGAAVEFFRMRLCANISPIAWKYSYWKSQILQAFDAVIRFDDLENAVEEVMVEINSYMPILFRRSVNSISMQYFTNRQTMLKLLGEKDISYFMKAVREATASGLAREKEIMED